MAQFKRTTLKRTRNSKKLTTRKLGNLVGVSGVTITRYETGERIPDLGMIEKLAEALDLVSYTELIKEDKPMTMSENYHFTLKQEVLKEWAAGILGQVRRYNRSQDISDESHPLTILRQQIARIQNKEIFQAKSMEQLNAIEGELEGLKKYFEAIVATMVEVA